MRYTLWLALLTGISYMPATAQATDPVMFTVNGRPVHKSEFEISYKKNNNLTDSTKESFKDFLQSYIDYQLNVEEAYAQQLDTTADFRFQRSIYKSSIAAPFLKESTAINERYIEKLKSYLQEDVEINHTLIPFSKEDIFPSDTLTAYKKAMALYEKLLSKGFNREINTDNTKSRSIEYNHTALNGYLGWVVPTMFPAKVVDAIYSLPLNKISKPIRTTKGYHIVEVLGRRPAVGRIKVDHIYFAFPQIPPTEKQVDSVLNTVKELTSSPDVNFDMLCHAFAEAYNLKEKGCSFDPFGLDAQLPMALITEAYKLKEAGNLSNPVISDVGVHLMRLVEQIPSPKGEELQGLANKILGSKDWAFFVTQDNQRSLFEKYSLKINNKSYRKILTVAGSIFPTDSSFASLIANKDDILFTIEDSVHVKVDRFAAFLREQVKTEEKDSYEKAVTKFLGERSGDPFNLSTEKLDWFLLQFGIRTLHNHVYNTLEARYPEMASMINEFAGGLLAFEVKDKNIYKKAEHDIEGMKHFFEQNKHKYTWNEPRFKGYEIRCPNENSYKLVKIIVDSTSDDVNLISLINQEFADNLPLKPQIVKGLWRKGENDAIDDIIFDKKEMKITDNIILEGRLINSPEEYNDVKGLLLADYQDFLENEWINNLRMKYKVDINTEILRTVQ